jgi:hypothetical protein
MFETNYHLLIIIYSILDDKDYSNNRTRIRRDLKMTRIIFEGSLSKIGEVYVIYFICVRSGVH